jgi:hypothetical protein
MTTSLNGLTRVGDLLNPKVESQGKTRASYGNILDMFGNDLILMNREYQNTINQLRYIHGATQHMETGNLKGAESYLEGIDAQLRVVSKFDIKRKVHVDALEAIITDPIGTSTANKVSMSYIGNYLKTMVESGSYYSILESITDSTQLSNLKSVIAAIDTNGDIQNQLDLQTIEDSINTKLATLVSMHTLGSIAAADYYDYLLGDALTAVSNWKLIMMSVDLAQSKTELKAYVETTKDAIELVNLSEGSARVAAINSYKAISVDLRLEILAMISDLESFKNQMYTISQERLAVKYQIVTKQVASNTAIKDLKTQCIVVINEIDELLTPLRDLFYDSLSSDFILS